MHGEVTGSRAGRDHRAPGSSSVETCPSPQFKEMGTREREERERDWRCTSPWWQGHGSWCGSGWAREGKNLELQSVRLPCHQVRSKGKQRFAPRIICCWSLKKLECGVFLQAVTVQAGTPEPPSDPSRGVWKYFKRFKLAADFS